MTVLADCRLSTEAVAGWRAVVLENDLIRVVLLPERVAAAGSQMPMVTGASAEIRREAGEYVIDLPSGAKAIITCAR